MRKLHVVGAVAVLFVGLGHTCFTPHFTPGLTEQTAWFSSSGLALIFLGLLNWARLLTPQPKAGSLAPAQARCGRDA